MCVCICEAAFSLAGTQQLDRQTDTARQTHDGDEFVSESEVVECLRLLLDMCPHTAAIYVSSYY
jgi:hypothetical protein